MINSYYKSSGKFTLAGLSLGLVGGLLVGLLLAFAYAYIISYLPFVYLNFLCTIGFGALLGLAVGSLMRLGKVRSFGVAALVALVVAAASLYFSWAVWVSVLLGKADLQVGVLELAQQPAGLWEIVNKVNEVGAWKISNSTVSGGFLWLIWAAEAAIVLGGAVIAAAGMLGTSPFCESCQSWCSHTKGLITVADVEPAELKGRVEARDFDYVKGLAPKTEGQRDWARFDLYECPGCGKTNTLSVVRESITTDKKGNNSTNSSAVVKHLLLDKSEVYRLRQISQEMSQAPARA